MENFPDKISPMTLAAAIALGEGGGGQPSGEYLHYAGSITFSQLPALDVQKDGFVYDVTDGFTSTSDFTDGGGKVYSAGTNVAIVNRGTVETPVMKYDCMSGDFSNFVVKEPGKSLSTNDYTDAEKALVQDSPITVSATGTDLTLSTSSGNLNALTVYGKSEVVDGAIVSAGEGWSTVDLGTLTWTYREDITPKQFRASFPQAEPPQGADDLTPIICPIYKTLSYLDFLNSDKCICRFFASVDGFNVIDSSCATLSEFLNKINGVILAYKEATPTNNTIAVKTDNGSGIDGTMAVFTTGTPLRSIPDTTVRDVMTWDGRTGTVTKVYAEVDLGTLAWSYDAEYRRFLSSGIWQQVKIPDSSAVPNFLCPNYVVTSINYFINSDENNIIACGSGGNLSIRNTTYTDPAAFKTAMNGVKLVYELATPTTIPLTTAENASIAELRTFEPQTHAQNNAGTNMTVEAYAGTANGKAVQELKQDVQSEISALKITQSGALSLTVNGWSSNQQTVTYAHDTSKRNVIDVDPSSVEEWANCGILATAETASGITFTCKTVPENALTFRVTSMGVN